MMMNPVDAGGSGGVFFFLIPGFIAAIIARGNVHDFQSWVVVLGNFVFYFVFVYFGWGILEKYIREKDDGKKS